MSVSLVEIRLHSVSLLIWINVKGIGRKEAEQINQESSSSTGREKKVLTEFFFPVKIMTF